LFRLVNEAHCPATKKNKEWQEKLPVVVLKAEEIMYSKANSEVEAFFFFILLLSIEIRTPPSLSIGNWRLETEFTINEVCVCVCINFELEVMLLGADNLMN
jgi:hypothetical protein